MHDKCLKDLRWIKTACKATVPFNFFAKRFSLVTENVRQQSWSSCFKSHMFHDRSYEFCKTLNSSVKRFHVGERDGEHREVISSQGTPANVSPKILRFSGDMDISVKRFVVLARAWIEVLVTDWCLVMISKIVFFLWGRTASLQNVESGQLSMLVFIKAYLLSVLIFWNEKTLQCKR